MIEAPTGRASPKRIDITGQSFHWLKALHYVGMKNGKSVWHCKCICGNEVEVASSELRRKMTKSCGCYRKHASKLNAEKRTRWVGK